MAIQFNEDRHQYFDEVGTLISATQLIAKFKQPFDAPAIAERYAQKNGETPQYWIDKWEANKVKACDRGTAFHKLQEELSLGRGVHMFYGTPKIVQNKGMYIENLPNGDLYDIPDGLYTELMLWHTGYRISGTADVVNIETKYLDSISKSKIRYVDIDDYKTNGRIDTTSYYFASSGTHKMMLGPLSHLMDCNFQHYELQISLYAFMLECFGFIPRQLCFTHYPQEDLEDPFKDLTPIRYPVQYRKTEVLVMIKAHRNEQRI